MFSFDVLWYHMPFAAAFAQTGSVTHIQFTQADPFVAYYPATSELVHALRDHRAGQRFPVAGPESRLDDAGPAGRPGRSVRRWHVQPLTLAVCAMALALPVLSMTQPGEAFDDIVGLAALLSAVALLAGDEIDGPRLFAVGVALGLGDRHQVHVRDPRHRARPRRPVDDAPSPAGADRAGGRGGHRHRRMVVPARADPHREPAWYPLDDRSDHPAGTAVTARRCRTTDRPVPDLPRVALGSTICSRARARTRCAVAGDPVGMDYGARTHALAAQGPSAPRHRHHRRPVRHHVSGVPDRSQRDRPKLSAVRDQSPLRHAGAHAGAAARPDPRPTARTETCHLGRPRRVADRRHRPIRTQPLAHSDRATHRVPAWSRSSSLPASSPWPSADASFRGYAGPSDRRGRGRPGARRGRWVPRSAPLLPPPLPSW